MDDQCIICDRWEPHTMQWVKDACEKMREEQQAQQPLLPKRTRFRPGRVLFSVFTVVNLNDEDYHCYGIFTTLEKAREFISKGSRGRLSIFEEAIDHVPEDQAEPVFRGTYDGDICVVPGYGDPT